MSQEKNFFYDIKVTPSASGDGFVSSFKVPGLRAGVMRDMETGEVRVFASADEAKIAATDRMMEVLNSPRERALRRTSKQERYIKLLGPEFADLLEKSGITLKLLADLVGTNDKRILTWIDGVNEKGEEERAPHYINVLLNIFAALPESVDIAEDVTDNFTVAKSSKVEAPFTPDQVAQIKAHQENPAAHPYTCPGDQPECADGRDLEVTAGGLICGCGAFKQTWAHLKTPKQKEA